MAIADPPVAVPLRMLVVEDSTEILDGLVLVLGTRNVDVVCAKTSAGEAIDWLRDHPGGCDIAIVDDFLRDSTGLDVLRFLQNEGSAVGRVVFTASARA